MNTQATPPPPLPVNDALDEAAAAARRLVRRQAAMAAGVSLVPIFGVDLLINAKLMAETVRRINAAFGLSPEQIARLPGPLKSRVDELIRQVGSVLIGRVVTQAVLLQVVRGMGLRLSAQQAAKLAPLAGMAASAALAGWLFKRVAERHIRHCVEVRQALANEPLALEAPDRRLLEAR